MLPVAAVAAPLATHVKTLSAKPRAHNPVTLVIIGFVIIVKERLSEKEVKLRALRPWLKQTVRRTTFQNLPTMKPFSSPVRKKEKKKARITERT